MRIQKSKIRNLNERGNIIVALLLVLLITSFEVYYFFISHSNSAASTQRRHLIHGTVNEALSTAGQLLISPKSLMNSVRGPLNKINANLERCMSDGTYDCPPDGGPFSIYQDDPALIFSDAINPDAGINFSNQPCSGYSSSAEPSCVIQLKLTWKPECPISGPCYLPPIEVEGFVEVKTSFLEKLVFNRKSFTFSKRIR